MTLVRVEWLDPTGTAIWASRKDAATLTPMRCTTVGVIVHQTRDTLVMAATVGDNEQVADITAIPMGCILAMRPITAPRASRGRGGGGRRKT